MRVSLNLATRPFADLGPAIKRLRIGMGALALLSILLGVGLHAIHQKAEAARTRAHSLDGQIARISQEEENYKALMKQPDNAELLKQAAVLNRIIDGKAFSWTLAMEDLETVLPGGVQVTSLEPARQKDGHITLTLRVSGPRDRAVDLVRNLEHSRRFLLPRIIGESTSESNNDHGGSMRLQPVSAGDRVDFDVQAEYNPATPEERKAYRKPPARLKAADESSMPASRPTGQRTTAPTHLAPAGPIRPLYTGPAQQLNRLPNSPVPPGARFPSQAPADGPKPNPGGVQ
jgi:type IV pilus assembly protein PilN